MGIFYGIESTWASNTDKGRTHISTKGVVQNGLILNLDTGSYISYSGSGTTWNDLSGNGNNATLYNGPTYSSNNGGVISFDGINEYLQIPTITLNTNTGFTIDLWIYIVDPQTTYQNFWAYWYSNSAYNFEWGTYQTNLGKGRFSFKDNNVGVGLDSPYIGNQWANIIFGCNSTTPFLYTNGVLSGTGGNFTNTDILITTLFTNSDRSRYYKATQSTIRFYNRVLSTQEIQQNYESTKSRYL